MELSSKQIEQFNKDGYIRHPCLCRLHISIKTTYSASQLAAHGQLFLETLLIGHSVSPYCNEIQHLSKASSSTQSIVISRYLVIE